MRIRLRFAIAGLLATASASALAAAPPPDWLPLGSKNWSPSIFSKSGIGTANAKASAKATRKDIADWCENWQPGDKQCVSGTLATEEAKRSYHASADCTRGRITAVDGNTYTLAGKWNDRDIGGGRARFRDAGGQFVGRDNASGGLGIALQWEILCPETGRPPPRGAVVAAPAPAPRPAVAPPGPAHGVMPASFAIGQIVEARYLGGWQRGQVRAIRQVAGARGPELAYEVHLDIGKRGLLPTRMLRPAR